MVSSINDRLSCGDHLRADLGGQGHGHGAVGVHGDGHAGFQIFQLLGGGVHQDGLVHISEISEKYIKHPSEALSVGDIVTVKIKGVDLNKKRISLTMKM